MLEVDIAALVDLDNAVRRDIPGCERWAGTVADLRETWADKEFDPALSLVAEHRGTGRLDGLVRVWWRTPYPRLGCVGVRREWRRTRVAAMLLGAVARELGERGVTHVVTETDESNSAAHGMARRRGGLPTRVLLELVRAPS